MDLQKCFATSSDEGRVMASLINAHDWQSHPLGEIAIWPQALRNFVSTMLASRFPMYLAWGNEGYSFYNDGYIPILTDKHPLAIGATFENVWGELSPEIRALIDKTKEDKTSYFQDMPLMLLKNGSLEQCYFTFSYSGVRGDSGEVEGFYAVCLETTDAFHAKQKQVNENERLRTLFQQAPGYIAVVSGPSHTYEIANDAYHQLIGNRQLIGKPVGEAVPELVGQGYIRVLDEILQSGKAYFGQAERVLLQRGDGEQLEERYLNFILQPIVDSSKKVSGVFIEGSDVTDAVNAAAILRASEERLRQLANNLPHLAWMANSDGHIHWYNNRWYEYTGTTEEQMLGWGWQAVHDPEKLPMVVQHWKASLESGDPWELTFPLRSATGEFRTFFTRAAPLRDEAGTIVQWFGTNTDVTEIKAAEDELKAANLRKDEFLAMLAHELRNPLAPISTAAEILNMGRVDEARVKQTASIIARQVTHMTKLVDDLLDVSRVTRGLVTMRADILNLNDLVADAVEQIHSQIQAKKHQLIVQTADEPCYVKGDRTRLIQVIANLLHNAARYTPTNGHIVLRVTAQFGAVVVSVTDNGIGLAPTLTPHIFELFTQGERSSDRGQGGLGLGLALVKSLVELHAGSVSVTSEGVGKGSEFVIRLPRVTEAGHLRQVSGESPTAQQAQTGLPLMVVDDNEDAAQMLALLLETLGHQVWVANDGHAALVTAQRAAPSILFLDIGLPDMDGYELARRLRQAKETASSVLVAVTGYGQPEDKERALKAGFDHHLVKPVKMSAVQSLLESRNQLPGQRDLAGQM